jgi:hypothetical protein
MNGRKLLELYTHLTKLNKNIIKRKKIDTILQYLGININTVIYFTLKTCSICKIIGVFNLTKSHIFDVFNNKWTTIQSYIYCDDCWKK